MNILFTICGRAGSKGFRNKNLKEMNDVPLVYYTMAVIEEYRRKHPWDYADTVLNTDSEPLMKIVKEQKRMNVEFVTRTEELAGDAVPKADVIQDTYLVMKNNREYDAVIDLDLTSPLRTVSDIENATAEYFKNPEYDLVYSVVKARRSPYFNMVQKSSDGYYHKVCKGNITARQQVPECYELNAGIYVYSPKFLSGSIEKPISEYKAGISLMRDYLILDIDSEEDFKMMELLHRFYCSESPELDSIYRLAKDMNHYD